MIAADFDRIEQSLGVRLPDAYRRRMAPFPLARKARNADDRVWDDAEELILLNRSLRADRPDWPDWLFVIGRADRDLGGYAIDVRDPACPVWRLESVAAGPSSGGTTGIPFDAWFNGWLARAAAPKEDVAGFFFVWLGVCAVLLAAAALYGAWLFQRSAPVH